MDTLLDVELNKPKVRRIFEPEQIHSMLEDRYLKSMSVKNICKKYKISYQTWARINNLHAHEFRKRFDVGAIIKVPTVEQQIEFYETHESYNG